MRSRAWLPGYPPGFPYYLLSLLGPSEAQICKSLTLGTQTPGFRAREGSRALPQSPPLQRTGSVTALRPEGPGLEHPQQGGQGPLKHLSQGKAQSSGPHAPHSPVSATCSQSEGAEPGGSGLSRWACGCPSPNPVHRLHSKEPPLRSAGCPPESQVRGCNFTDHGATAPRGPWPPPGPQRSTATDQVLGTQGPPYSMTRGGGPSKKLTEEKSPS